MARKLPTKATAHGGRSLEGRRKAARPLIEKKLTHVVLTSSEARGKLAFIKHLAQIEEILETRAIDFDIVVEEIEVRGPRLHLFLKFNSREKFQGFLRTITALIARRVTGAKKGHPFGRKFWDHIAYTRTIETSDGAIDSYEKENK